ncbi:MAG: hypothetical protein J6X28_06270 [Bacilli bacterium]|nr:hypothetical protein [Bacilli bacterium]
MKETIKQDQKRLVLESELLNDNSLLEYVAEDGYMNVTVRFVSPAKTSIQEHNLLHMNIVEYMRHQGEVIQISKGKESIAIFSPTEEGYHLERVYDTNTHQFGSIQHVDIEYKRRFPKAPLEQQYIKRKPKGGNPNGQYQD